MKFLPFLFLLYSTGVFAETYYEQFDGGLRISTPFQMSCKIHNRSYILFVNGAEEPLRMLVDGKWIEPMNVRFGPAGILVVHDNAIDDDGRMKVFGFAVRSIFLYGSFGPMPVTYRYFVPGESQEHPYFEAKEPCEVID